MWLNIRFATTDLFNDASYYGSEAVAWEMHPGIQKIEDKTYKKLKWTARTLTNLGFK